MEIENSNRVETAFSDNSSKVCLAFSVIHSVQKCQKLTPSLTQPTLLEWKLFFQY